MRYDMRFTRTTMGDLIIGIPGLAYSVDGSDKVVHNDVKSGEEDINVVQYLYVTDV